MTYLVVDVETLPTERAMAEPYPELTRNPPGNFTKPETIAGWRERDRIAWQEDRIKTYSLNPRQGRICCLGWWQEGATAVGGFTARGETDEKALLEGFWDRIASSSPLVTFNGSFDLRFILVRAIVHGLKPPEGYQIANWFRRYSTSPHFDCRAVLTGWDDRQPGTLQDWALAFGIPIAGPLISGSQVYEAALAGRWNDIAAHCLDDVRITRELYLKLATIF